MKEKLYKILPNFLQNLFVHFYNRIAYNKRYGKDYVIYRKDKLAKRDLSKSQLFEYQRLRYKKLIEFVIQNSEFYKETLSHITDVSNIENIHKIPLTNKEIIRTNINKIVVKTDEKLNKSKTGGTTGKSLEVKNFIRNAQERFAFLDDFRSRFGYELGKKTAWFSGKSLLTNRDVNKNRFWKTDPIYNVRYYSTFHISDSYLKYYVENIIQFKPEYLVGFPSTMLEIAKFGTKNGYIFPSNTVKAIFPTAETITDEIRSFIEDFFKAKIYNQYASSEGAPFIFECINGNLHLELQSGIFEVLDETNQPAKSGRLIVTSFTNEGTPLIRYDIGDRITLEEDTKICNCGNNNPLVKEILGRINDFIYSPEVGKINLGNVSNTLKDTKGIIRFQVVQDELDTIDLLVVKDDKEFNESVERKFIQNWRDRIGNKMYINIKYVQNIPVEKSGKYRLVKNNIKHLIN